MAGHRGVKEHVTAEDRRIWDESLVKARRALEDARAAHRRGHHGLAKGHTKRARDHITAHDRRVDAMNARKEPKSKRSRVGKRTASKERRDSYGRFLPGRG